MPSTSRIDIRLTEEEKEKAQEQARKLLGESGTVSEYIRLIINLDAATGLIEKLKEGK
jgi:mannitol/fructose-specific phosphotransferase system IIA component